MIIVTRQSLVVDMRVKILERGEEIDEGIIRKLGIGGSIPTKEIAIESLRSNPGQIIEFAFIVHQDPDKEGWRMLFEDPMAGGRCYSQRAPTFMFVPIF